MAFHRLTNATYHVPGGGDLLAGYDKLNDPTHASVGGSGTPAPVDGIKAGGSNDGTYFAAFGEDATSAFQNRANSALAENTDDIDAILHESIPRAVTTDATASGAVSSFQITGDVFVGISGATNDQDQRDRLVHILDQNDNEIEVAGTKIVATLIHDGASANVVGTVADGFYTDPTVDVSPSIPNGTNYRVVYGLRSNYDDISRTNRGALGEVDILGYGRVTTDVQITLRTLHAATGQAWNDSWDATIRALASAGLNERYRRSTAEVGSFTYDTPGDGATIVRDGQAIVLQYPDVATNDPVSTPYSDKWLAGLRAQSAEVATASGWPDLTKGGDVFLFSEVDVNSTGQTNEYTRNRTSGPMFLEAIPRDIRASTLGGNNVISRVNSTLVGSANPDSAATTAGRRTIEVNTADFITDGSGNRSVRVTDLIEVINDSTGVSYGVFRVESYSGTRRVLVKTLAGGDPTFGDAAVSVRLKWYQPTIVAGGNAQNATTAAEQFYPFMVMSPASLTNSYATEHSAPSAVFLSKLGVRDTALAGITPEDTPDIYSALAWGGFGRTGSFSFNGRLMGDGGISCVGGRQALVHINTKKHAVGIDNAGGTKNITMFPVSSGSFVAVTASAGAWTAATTFAFAFDGDYTPVEGDILEILLRIPDGSTGALDATWPASFKFSENDEVIPTGNSTGAEIAVKYVGIYDGTSWYLTRTDY